MDGLSRSARSREDTGRSARSREDTGIAARRDETQHYVNLPVQQRQSRLYCADCENHHDQLLLSAMGIVRVRMVMHTRARLMDVSGV